MHYGLCIMHYALVCTPLLEVTNGNCILTSIARICVRIFFCERVISPWNSLDITNDDVQSVAAFKRLVKRSNLSNFMYF